MNKKKSHRLFKTPVKTIQLTCRWCSTWQYKELKMCPVLDCSIWPYRHGKRPKLNRITPVGAIRNRCLDCGEGYGDIRNCVVIWCPLWCYRLGHRPDDNTKLKIRIFYEAENINEKFKLSDYLKKNR